MLPRAARLPSREFHSPRYRSVASPYFSLKIKMNQSGKPRIGVVANAAVHKSAAKRNFWKRQAKTALAGLCGAGGGDDLLIILSPRVTTLTKKQFRNEIAKSVARFAK